MKLLKGSQDFGLILRNFYFYSYE